MKNSMFKDESGNISAKRIAGAALLLFVMGLTAVSVFKGVDIQPNTAGLLTSFVIAAGGMLGIGVVEKFGKK